MNQLHITHPEDESSAYGRRASDWDAMPTWAKVVGFLGVPSSIAIFMVWKMVSWGDVMMSQAGIGRDIQLQLSQHIAAMAQISADQNKVLAQNEVIIRVLRSSCVNNAKSDTERERCLR